MNKNSSVSKIRTDRIKDNMPLTEKVNELSLLINELIDALRYDLSSIDLDNFSRHGITQINEAIADKIAESEATIE